MKKVLYESIYIIKDTDTKEEYKEAFEEIKNKLSKFEIEKIEELGRKRLAYPIKENEYGYYILIEFYAETKEDITELEAYCRQNDNILKWIFVDKD